VPNLKASVGKTPKFIALILAFTMLFLSVNLSLGTQSQTEYQRYVHNSYTDSLGNFTYVEKPVFPVLIANNSVPIGQNYTIVSPLEAGHSYHVYCYGAWVNTGPSPKTDYDIYVYNPEGTLESQHTEAAGLPEHLGTTVDAPFFGPQKTGNYTFVLANDARESHGSQQATFMIIENIKYDMWHSLYVQGTNGSQPFFNTSWAYEFMTDSPKIEVYLKVPNSLDMYEARLYLMNSPQSIKINNVSLPYELGLYGNGTGVGGYNMESEGYRGVAYASCEFFGQDMYLNYSTPTKGLNVYHIVLMGEVGEGNVDFLIKTSFGGKLSPLTIPKKVTPNNETLISYVTNSTQLENATLNYTIDNWKNTTQINMSLDNRTCNATIPKQQAGSLLQYNISATDILKNNLTAIGNFTVKNDSQITNFNATKNPLVLGNNITVTGTVSTQTIDTPIQVKFTLLNETKNVNCVALDNGTFTASFAPQTSGLWTAQAFFKGNDKAYETESGTIPITVNEPTFIQKNGLFLGVGFIGAIGAVGAVVYVKKYRGS
jgi:hypothetical protein